MSAPLINIPIVVPGSSGLNKQQETSVLDPAWATMAVNAVFDSSGRLAAREGWKNLTSSPMSGTPVVEQIFEQLSTVGVSTIISAAGSKLWSGTTAPSDITGTATVTVGNNWQFINFGGSVYGFQQGEQPIVRSSGNFADLTASSGTAPQGNCAVVHSGRVWASHSDKQTIKYSGLLDATAWATGAGSIDMTSVWPEGIDEIVALSFYNNRMVVFGKNRIVFFSDGDGFPLGLNPSTIQVSDTIVGVGCIARDSVRQIEGGDLLFLSAQGVISLSRLIQERSAPLSNVTKNVRDYLINYIGGETSSQIRSVYSPENAFYLLSFPTAHVTFCVDTFSRLQDGSYRITEWSTIIPRAYVRTISGDLYFSLATAGGKVGLYDGHADNSMPYVFEYASGWLDLGEGAQYGKMIKNLVAMVWISGNTHMSLKWDYDFEGIFNSYSADLVGPSSAEWGTMEWGAFEWGGGVSLRKVDASADGYGQFIRMGCSASIFGGSFAIQSIGLYTKVGRLIK